jgi:SAM-dependent methyltransferase
VSFTVAAEAYDRFMGRYSVPLAPKFAALAELAVGHRVLDVGCGPGALTTELVRLLGSDAVTAVDPSEPFVAAVRERHPGVGVEQASAESLPFPDRSFDAALAQLVVHFMADPLEGVREMKRVTRTQGVVAACVWDHAGGHGPLSLYWETVRELDPGVEDESALAGASRGDLERIFREAGPTHVEEHVLTVHVEHPSFEEWWEPFTLGVGPAGAYVAALTPERREGLRTRCRELHGPGPFTVAASVWAVRGTA